MGLTQAEQLGSSGQEASAQERLLAQVGMSLPVCYPYYRSS